MSEHDMEKSLKIQHKRSMVLFKAPLEPFEAET